MGTMNTSAIKTQVPVQQQDAAKTVLKDKRTDGSSGSVDAIFEAFLSQLLSTVIQNGQQPAAAATAETTDAVSDGTAASMVAPDASAVPVAQQPATQTDDAPMQAFLGVPEDTVIPDDAVKTDVPVPDGEQQDAGAPVKAQEKPADQPTRETTQAAPQKEGDAALAVEEARKELYNGMQTEYSTLLHHAEKEGDGGNVRSDESAVKQNTTEFDAVKSGLVPVMHQERQAAQAVPAHVNASEAAGTAGGHVPIHQRMQDAAESFDHTVSIVKDGNRLAVKLEPDGLGKLDINLSLDKGMVNAQIHVSHDATRALIENNMQQLVNTLIGEGLNVGGFTVSLNHGNAWNGASDDRQAGGAERDGPAAPAVIEAVRSPAPQGMVSIFV